MMDWVGFMQESYTFQYGDKSFKFSRIHVVNVIDTGMVYPQFKSVEEKELRECSLVFSYMMDAELCNFDNCLTQVKQSAELKALGLKDTVEIVVNVLKGEQELFTVREVGGFILQATGTSRIFIKNSSVIPGDRTRVGFLDLTETRRRFIHQYELQKLNSWNYGPLIFAAAAGATIAFILMKQSQK
jgi:hypothetical protein